MNFFENINHIINWWLNNFILNNNLENCIGFFSDFPIFFLPSFLVLVWLYWSFIKQNNEEKNKLIYIFYSVVFAIIINLIIQQFYFEQRPSIFVNTILEHLPDNSFPSDHATVSFTFLISLFFAWYKKISLWYLPFVLLMNFSRIAWWIHWFFDIIAWLIVWIFSSVVFFKYFFINKIFDKFNNVVIKILNYIKL